MFEKNVHRSRASDAEEKKEANCIITLSRKMDEKRFGFDQGQSSGCKREKKICYWMKKGNK